MHRILCLATITVLAAGAQVVEKKALTLDGAKKVIAAAEAEAVKNRVGCNIAVVDDGGNLIAFHRIDPTFPAGARVSIGKARTAALFRQPTKNFEDVITTKGRTSMIALDDFTPLQESRLSWAGRSWALSASAALRARTRMSSSPRLALRR